MPEKPSPKHAVNHARNYALMPETMSETMPKTMLETMPGTMWETMWETMPETRKYLQCLSRLERRDMMDLVEAERSSRTVRHLHSSSINKLMLLTRLGN